jgi:hypothetical protein
MIIKNVITGRRFNIGTDPEVGDATGYTFTDPKTGELIKVFSKKGETKVAAITRVRTAHGLPSGS